METTPYREDPLPPTSQKVCKCHGRDRCDWHTYTEIFEAIVIGAFLLSIMLIGIFSPFITLVTMFSSPKVGPILAYPAFLVTFLETCALAGWVGTLPVRIWRAYKASHKLVEA